ncbi:related to CEX1-cytoplasmic component of the nuclear aminoacylation-dependent tRNA export pathway [Sporisorium reilianum f. sp. reilianum]|uniref:Related to CEX1-cytoplasmic component of the nuclear aminoacylation-dependent tRNA export pathway n=1 Tax=Sporisorium reilianum f. sp. reilianum TaxID=72559 RepID=A0A2N8UC87_9BASI|nr:related to CEX1-cytoplasmic component of the nuclear aminoacylation-dependent tRNA export pathway [Sporisorium reilianum f. sp. reilianum]
MDYFKSLSSAASSVLSSARSGPLANYSIGNELGEYRQQTLWSLYSAVKRDDNTQCTVLAFDLSHPHNASRANLLPLAKNAARKLRTTRHPDVLKLLDSAETASSVYIAVEKATPLYKALAQSDDKRATPQRQDWIVWGLSSIVNAVKFLNIDAGSTHGNLRPESIFISAAGEWKLGGFEILTPHAESPHGLLFSQGSLIPDGSRYAPPEVKQNGWNVLSSMDSTLFDSYSLALVAIETFNGPLPPQAGTAAPPRGHVPPSLYSALQRMLVPNAKTRSTVARVWEAGEAEGGFFKENTLVKVARGLDGFLLATENEKASIIKLLQEKPDSFTPDFLMYKVLPALVAALAAVPPPGTIPSASTQPSLLLPLVLRLGQPLPKEEWNANVVPPLLKAFASPDRSTRMALLENLSLYAERMDNRVVVDKLWPNLITGFNDSVPVIREATLKAILPLAPKLSDRILNNDLLRVLARTQVDPEAGIRTNTTILLGRLVPHLSVSTRKKVLIPAFSRSLKDQFVHARVAGLMALMATGDSFDHEDCARHVLPAVTPCMVDKEKLVRDQADKAVKMFFDKVESGRVGMPDTVLIPEQLNGSTSFGGGSASADAAAANGAGYATAMAASAGSAATALAGWAMSSALSSLSNSSSAPSVPDGKPLSSAAELQSKMDGRSTPSISMGSPAAPTASQAVPPSSGLASLRLGSGSALAGDAPSYYPASTASSAATTKSPIDYDLDDDAPSASTASAFHMQPSDADLMDVHDDSADWSSFEVGQPKKKPSVGRTKMAKAKLGPRRTASNNAASAAAAAAAAAAASRTAAAAAPVQADPVHAISRSSLKVAAPVEEAWGDGGDDVWDATNPAPAASAPAAERMLASLSATSSRDDMATSQELTTQAFETPVPKTIAADAGSGTATPADEWAAFDDDAFDDEQQRSRSASPAAAAAAAAPLSKEERKAELERKRNERRLRLEQLKREKEEARLRAL